MIAPALILALAVSAGTETPRPDVLTVDADLIEYSYVYVDAWNGGTGAESIRQIILWRFDKETGLFAVIYWVMLKHQEVVTKKGKARLTMRPVRQRDGYFHKIVRKNNCIYDVRAPSFVETHRGFDPELQNRADFPKFQRAELPFGHKVKAQPPSPQQSIEIEPGTPYHLLRD